VRRSRIPLHSAPTVSTGAGRPVAPPHAGGQQARRRPRGRRAHAARAAADLDERSRVAAGRGRRDAHPGRRRRQRVPQVAQHAVRGQVEPGAVGALVPQQERELLLGDALVGPAPHVRERGRRRVARVLGGGERSGVLGARIVGQVEAERRRRRRTERMVGGERQPPQLGPGVIAEALHAGARRRERGHRRPEPPGRARLHLAHAVRAGRRLCARRRPARGRRQVGAEVEHPTRRVPVQRRRRAAQHLDAFEVGQVDVRELALPVGKVCGTPSSRTRTPRVPKLARAPKPRTLSRWSTLKLYRLATYTPGTSASASSRPTVRRPARSARASTTPTAHGARSRAVGVRVTVTVTGASRAVSARTESGRAGWARA
jgi:hypothetical protein